MVEMTGMMQIARQAMTHAADRQRLVARNVANADTPGFRAQDAAPFDPSAPSGLALRRTNARHLDAAGSSSPTRIVDAGGEASPNGNTVSLEDEMVRAADARREHDLALTVYQSGLRLMRTAVARRG